MERRNFLKLGGAAAVSAFGVAAGTASAATTVEGVTFDRQVNMVDDVGADPNGDDPVQNQIEQAAADDTLLYFPAGTYRITGNVSLSGMRNFGILGEEGTVFKLDAGTHAFVPSIRNSTRVVVKGFTIDQRANRALGWTRFGSTGIIKGVDITIRGANEAQGRDTHKFKCLPYAESGAEVVLKRFAAPDGGPPGVYPDGGGGVYVAANAHQGVLKMIDCHLEGFPNNGIYGSRCQGDVRVEGGLYKNSEAANIRISGEGSYVDGATIVVDKDDWGPEKIGDKEDHKNMRGIRWEGRKGPNVGGEVRNCVIKGLSSNLTQGLLMLQWNAGRITVKNTKIYTELDGTPAINSQAPEKSNDNAAILQNVSITGPASGGRAVRLVDRDGSSIRNCCIQQAGGNRDGIHFSNSGNCEVVDTNVNVDGSAVTTSGSDVSTANITHSETCPRPEDGDDGGLVGSFPSTVTVQSTGSDRAHYEFSVSEELQGGYSYNPNGEYPDAVEGTTATGSVAQGGSDDYNFAGELTALSVDGPAEVAIDGTVVDPADYSDPGDGSDDDGSAGDGPDDGESGDDGSDGDDGQDSLSRTLTVQSMGSERAHYALAVGDAVEGGDRYNPDGEYPDAIEGTTASGSVAMGGSDDYQFAGDLTALAVDGPAEVAVDGEVVDPADYPDPGDGSDDDGSAGDGSGDDGSDDDGQASPSHTVTVQSMSTDRAHYELAVSDAIEGGDRYNPDGESPDAIEGTTATGSVAQGGTDDYDFAGELTALSVDGPAEVAIDGTVVDPADYPDPGDGSDDDGQTSPSHTVIVRSTGAERAHYELVASDAIEGGDGYNPDGESPDAIEGTTATGSVAQGGTDDYRFAGELVDVSVDGPAEVTVERGTGTDEPASGDPPNSLVVDGTGVDSRTTYAFEVTGTVEKDSSVGSANPNDEVSDGAATGQVNGGIDAYRFSGDVVSLSIDGDATLSFEDDD